MNNCREQKKGRGKGAEQGDQKQQILVILEEKKDCEESKHEGDGEIQVAIYGA